MIRGWLLIDKPEGITSAQVVRVVKRKFEGLKVGHAGTLDPLASGLLPLALGEATKTVSYIMSEEKGYTFDLVWGEQRKTDDSEGVVIARSDKRPTLEEIRALVPSFQGTILQKPPSFSALKVGGQRAYDLARKGDEVTLEPRAVHVKSLDYEGTTPAQEAARFRVLCGKGTYVRSLARDLALSLDTVGYARHIRRFKVGFFEEKDALSFERLEKLDRKELIRKNVLPLETVLVDIPALDLSSLDRDKLCQGQVVDGGQNGCFSSDFSPQTPDCTVLCRGPDGLIFAIARYVQGRIKPVRLLKVK